jgi:(4S)-4-hydroxy-5-phosphonooxypentane-2,3-dione isomerase
VTRDGSSIIRGLRRDKIKRPADRQFGNGGMMIVRVIDVFVIDDRVDDFRVATEKNHLASIQESGILRFDVLQDVENRSHFILYEVYRSDDATDAHKQTPHYAEWKAEVEPMMAGSRTSTSCNPIAPLNPEMW